MSHDTKLSNYILFSELKFHNWKKIGKITSLAICEKTSNLEVCPKCATPSSVVYDRRWVRVRDTPIRGKAVILEIKKRRFFCHKCKKPFTEPVSGILPKRRTTQRYRSSVLWACETFSCLNKVQKEYRCSSGFIYKTLYEQLSLRIGHKLNYSWPEKLGIDEHFFSRKGYSKRFVTVFTDIKNKRLREVVLGKDKASLISGIQNIPGRKNVKWITLDLADSYKYFAMEHFPNARLVADKFHVLRLLHPAINKRRKDVTGDKRSLPVRKMLLRSAKKMSYFERQALLSWLDYHKELREVYLWKEALHSLYRIKGYERAKKAFFKMLEKMKKSQLPEIKRLRRTLKKWCKEILNYFKSKLTNARTEGFNRVASLVKNRAFGYRSFENYRLRLLNACF